MISSKVEKRKFHVKLIVNRDVFIAVYNAHAHSHLSYVILALGSNTNVKILLILKKKEL